MGIQAVRLLLSYRAQRGLAAMGTVDFWVSKWVYSLPLWARVVSGINFSKYTKASLMKAIKRKIEAVEEKPNNPRWDNLIL